MNIEQLEIEKEEVEREMKQLQETRHKFARTGVISESDFPIDDVPDFRKAVLDIIDKKIELKEWINSDLEQSLSVYK